MTPDARILNPANFIICLCFVLASTAPAGATEIGGWVRGTPEVIDANTLSIGGQQIKLHGIMPIGARSMCDNGAGRMSCELLVISELGRLMSKSSVLCKVVDEDAQGRLTGRCVVGDLELATELIRQGLAQPDRGVDLTGQIEAEGPTAQGGPQDPLGQGPLGQDLLEQEVPILRPAPPAVVPPVSPPQSSSASRPTM